MSARRTMDASRLSLAREEALRTNGTQVLKRRHTAIFPGAFSYIF